VLVEPPVAAKQTHPNATVIDVNFKVSALSHGELIEAARISIAKVIGSVESLGSQCLTATVTATATRSDDSQDTTPQDRHAASWRDL
jgi:hypothetical protein